MKDRNGCVMRNPLLDDLEAAVELLHKSADALGIGPVGEAAIEERFREEGVYRMHCPEPEVLATSLSASTRNLDRRAGFLLGSLPVRGIFRPVSGELPRKEILISMQREGGTE